MPRVLIIQALWAGVAFAIQAAEGKQTCGDLIKSITFDGFVSGLCILYLAARQCFVFSQDCSHLASDSVVVDRYSARFQPDSMPCIPFFPCLVGARVTSMS